MENGIYTTVRDCHDYTQNKLSEKRRHPPELHPVNGLLEYVTMDIWRPFRRMLDAKEHDLVRKDRCLKVTRAIPTSKVTASRIVSLFMDNWIIPYCILAHLLTDNGTQIVIKIYSSPPPQSWEQNI